TFPLWIKTTERRLLAKWSGCAQPMGLDLWRPISYEVQAGVVYYWALAAPPDLGGVSRGPQGPNVVSEGGGKPPQQVTTGALAAAKARWKARALAEAAFVERLLAGTQDIEGRPMPPTADDQETKDE